MKRARHLSKNPSEINSKKQKLYDTEVLQNKHILVQIKDEVPDYNGDAPPLSNFSIKKHKQHQEGPFQRQLMNLTATKNDSCIDFNRRENNKIAKASLFLNDPEIRDQIQNGVYEKKSTFGIPIDQKSNNSENDENSLLQYNQSKYRFGELPSGIDFERQDKNRFDTHVMSTLAIPNENT